MAPGPFLIKFDVNLTHFEPRWLLVVFLLNLMSICLILASDGSWSFSYQIWCQFDSFWAPVASGRFLVKLDVNLLHSGLRWLLVVFLSNLMSIWLILRPGGSWSFSCQIWCQIAFFWPLMTPYCFPIKFVSICFILASTPRPGSPKN